MLVRGLLARCAGRVAASDREWCPVGEGYGREIPEGTLLLRQTAEGWMLAWCMSTTEVRPIAHGSRGEVEQDTHGVILFGLPGGAQRRARASWGFEEGSLHHETGDGSFRLMVQNGGRGGLVFVRQDGAVFFLGEDRVEVLTTTAGVRLQQHRGAPLHAWFAGRRLSLRGVGVVGVVGQAELARDVRVVLVQVDHDRFEMHVATIGDACGLLGVYSGADLLRGDLGAILFAGPAQQGALADYLSDLDPVVAHGPLPGRVEPALDRTESPTPPQPTQPRTERPPATGKNSPPPPSRFTEDDRQRLDTCLTPRRREYIGAGAMVMPYLYRGFRLLADDALESIAEGLRLFADPLRVKVIRDRLEAKLGAPIPGHARTFTRGLLRFLAETGLGEHVGHRYQLHLGDRQRLLSMLRANYEPSAPTTGRASPQTPEAAAPSSSPPSPRAEAAAPSSSSSPQASAWATPSPTGLSSPHSFTSMGEPPVGDLLQPGDQDPGPGDLVVGWPPTLRRDGRLTYYERRYARTDPESPSQFPGVNPRGPPDS